MHATGEVVVRRTFELPAGIEKLRRESSVEGFRHVERLCRDWECGENRFDRPGEAFFVAHVGPLLAGVCGLNRDPFSSDAACGRLRRLYVAPAMRRRGVASRLTQAVLGASADAFSLVRLRTFDLEASAFYLALGFAAVVSDPQASHELRIARPVSTSSSR